MHKLNASRGETIVNTRTTDKVVSLCSSGTSRWLMVSLVASRHSFIDYKHQVVSVMTTVNSVINSPQLKRTYILLVYQHLH